MSTETSWVQPETLRRLREDAGLSIEDTAAQSVKLKRAGFVPVTARQLQQWESGHGTPELEHLETLSELYSCPVGHFFLSETPEEEIALSFRGLAPGKEADFDATTRAGLRQFTELCTWFVTVLEEHGVDWQVGIPESPPRPARPSQLAQRERRRLGFSESIREEWESADDAIGWWRKQIEAQGVFCFEFKLNPKDIRGASLWINQRYPFILVNRQHAESATGRLFTLLHEYGHLLLARGRQGIACDFRGRGTGHFDEPLVNEFAACVLLPARELRAYLSQQGQDQFRENWSDEALKEIAAPFFVSRDVVAITLEEIGLAPPGFYRRKQQLWERRAAKYKPWGRGGKALKKWQRKARELGGSAMRAMLRLHAADRLPVLDAAYVLDTKVERVGEFLGEFKTLVQDAES